MNEVRIGLIGAGGIASGVHLPGIEAARGGKLTALCDIDEERLTAAAERYGIPENRRFRDYRELIACPDVDAVDICTPNYLHAEMAIAATRAGKAVCVEKPIAMSVGEALRIRDAVKSAGVPSMVCFSNRFRSAVRFAKWIMDRGLLGKVANLYVEYLKSSAFIEGRRLEWRFIKDMAGTGVLGDLGSHLIDMARFLVGDIDGVTAQTGILVKKRPKLDSDEIGEVETDDYCHFLAELSGGAAATFSISRCAMGNANSIKFEIYGSAGALAIDLNRPDELCVCLGDVDRITEGMHWVRVPARYRSNQMQSFIDIVRGEGDGLAPTIDDGVECQRVLDALVASSQERCWVDIIK
ncbi:MAG: Gfo/Idh/MocA family protein [Christensenellales bacterium]|jgi:predicted dehydrogenase